MWVENASLGLSVVTGCCLIVSANSCKHNFENIGSVVAPEMIFTCYMYIDLRNACSSWLPDKLTQAQEIDSVCRHVTISLPLPRKFILKVTV